MARDWQTLNAIMELRRTAADVVTLADIVIFDTDGTVALRQLPRRIRTLQTRARRALEVLERRGQP
jgi:hypothetical protein